MFFKIVALTVKESLIGLINRMSEEDAASLMPMATRLIQPAVQPTVLPQRINVAKSAQKISAADGMILRLIPATSSNGVLLGGNGESDNPEHSAIIKKPFYIGKYPVTNREWDITAKDNRFKGILTIKPSSRFDERFTPDSHPVVGVNWFQATKFLFLHSLEHPNMPQERKNEIWRTNSGFQIADNNLGRILSDWILHGVPMDRLPTEAEWEYAARAVTRSRFHSGDTTDDLNRVAVWNTNSTKPVGTKEANLFGLHDVHGNVWEWNADWYDSKSFSNTRTTLIDPVGSENGKNRVLRGGSWYGNSDRRLQSASRYGNNPDESHYFVGFRLVRTNS